MNMNTNDMCKETREIYDTLMENKGFPELLEDFEDAESFTEANDIFDRICKKYPEMPIILGTTKAPVDGLGEIAIAHTEYEEKYNGKIIRECAAIGIYPHRLF